MQRFLRPFSFSLMGVIILLLIAGSVVEHIYGTAFAVRYVYTAPWTIALWTLATVSGLAYLVTIFRTKGWENLFTFLLHFSFVVILAGAMITHVWGVQGELHLRSDKAQTVHSESSVSVFLWDFQVVYAADGETPVDYITELRLLDRSREETTIDEGTIRMNKPLRYHGYRFCQSDYDSDLNGVVLAYSYDPWGTGVTYAGYALLLLSIIGFFFQKGTYFRVLWRELIDRSPRAGKVGVGVLAAVIIVLAWVMTKVVTPKPPLLPVLQTPLLGIHVAVIMMAYTLFGTMMIIGIVGLFMLRSPATTKRLQTLAQLLLYPAVFCLTIGVFIGAVWANLSWGRYWGWDPKEVWALVTLMVYALMIHTRSIPWLQKPVHYYVACIVAFVLVLFTYFGVNLILGGLHSYAN